MMQTHQNHPSFVIFERLRQSGKISDHSKKKTKKQRSHSPSRQAKKREIQGGADLTQLEIENHIKKHIGPEDNWEQPFAEGGLMLHQNYFRL